MTDEDLRTLLQRTAADHEPDLARIRNRFDQETRGDATTRRWSPVTHGRARALLLPGGLVAAAAVGVGVGLVLQLGLPFGTGDRDFVTLQPGAVASGPALGAPSPGLGSVAAATSGASVDASRSPGAAVTPTGSRTPAGQKSPTGQAPAGGQASVVVTVPATGQAVPAASATSANGPTIRVPVSSRAASASAAGTGPTTSATGDRTVGTGCVSGDFVVRGVYQVVNNLWGADRGTGAQCTSVAPASASALSWSTDWDWSGGPGQVKSFASVVRGWHWGWAARGTGLPLRLADRVAVRSSWSYTLTERTTTAYDVAYDLWFHTKADPTSADTPTAEVRVVLSQSRPVATTGRAATLDIGGATWAVFRTTNGWPVTTFVRTTPSRSVSLNLTQFTDVAAGLGGLGSSTYLTSVEAGVDVATGSGRLDTTAYSVDIGN